jgi:hypothetical protein
MTEQAIQKRLDDRRVPYRFDNYVDERGGWRDDPGEHGIDGGCPHCGKVDDRYLAIPRQFLGDTEVVCEGCARFDYAHSVGQQDLISDLLISAVEALQPHLIVRTTAEMWAGAFQEAAEGMISH